jgi:integral membrane protein
VLEGSSYLLLLGVAMPLKYIAGKPEMVENVGWIHGLLFIGYSLLVLHAWRTRVLDLRWSITVMIAAVLPFGPFVLDGKLRELSAQGERLEG